MALRFFGVLLVVVGAAACAPEIGDDCQSSVDCDVNGERICDVAQPGGYCTIRGCDSRTCPDEALCVEFRFEPERLSSTWCLAACDDDSDCRSEEGYRCITAPEVGTDIARVIDEGNEGARFCSPAPR